MASGEASPLVLEVLTGLRAGEKIAVQLPLTVGSGREADLVFDDDGVSSLHGRFEAADDVIRFVDRSAHGASHRRGDVRTALGGECAEAELWDEDELHLGTAGSGVILRIRTPQTAPAPVIAQRSIDDLETYAERVTAQPGQLGVLFRYTVEFGSCAHLSDVLATASRMVFELIPKATHIAVALEERAGRFPVVFAHHQDGSTPEVPISRTLVKQVLDARAGLLVSNAAEEFANARSVVQAGMSSIMSVPLWTGNRVRGVIQVDNRDKPRLFTGDDLELLTVAAGHISLAAENARLVERLQSAEQRLATENQFLKDRDANATTTEIIGQSAPIKTVIEGINKVANLRVPVLITGETGTGKELVARALHYSSNRREGLFVAQNCSALSENLLESELFGHVRGAFTGADRDKKGLFELADGGTIFLDELGEMPLTLQAKLLRVLQEGEVWPVGAPRPKRIDARVVSATHRDLEEMVRENTFRQDLYYRLVVFPIEVPPLRKRREDIPLLAAHFMRRYAKEFGLPASGYSADAMTHLKSYDWPGNVRELQNEIQRQLIQRGGGDLILADDLSQRLLGNTGIVNSPELARGTLKEMMNSVERVLLSRSLREHENNKTRAAQALGITREGLHKKLTRFGMV